MKIKNFISGDDFNPMCCLISSHINILKYLLHMSLEYTLLKQNSNIFAKQNTINLYYLIKDLYEKFGAD